MRTVFQVYSGHIERKIFDDWEQLKSIEVDKLDAMAEVLGFEINWKHDPRPVEDIVKDSIREQEFGTALATKFIRRMMKVVRELRRLDELFNHYLDELKS